MVASPVIASKPCLWTADLGAVISLASRFATGDLFNVSPNLEFGQHIILVDRHTPEVIVRKAIYQIISSGNSPEIYEAQQPIAIIAAHESLSAGELAGQIVGTSQTGEKWLEGRSQERLSLKDAVEIALVILAYEQEPQKTVELGILKDRCHQSSYDWNKLMGKLEKQFSEELQKRGVTLGNGNKTDSVDLAKIQEQYIGLLESVADDTAIEEFKIQIREEYPGLQPSELNKLLDALANKFQKQQAQVDEVNEIKSLVGATEETISVHDYLPEKLANPLAQYGQWQKLRHSVLLTSFLTAVSSLHKVGTELIIHHGLNFRVIPTLYGAIVAESSAKKSPALNATARYPLNILKDLDKETYKRNLELYEAELAEWEEEKAALPKGQKMSKPEPREPAQPPIYYFSDATGEGIKAQSASDPEKALFGMFDELKGFLNTPNQYRGGRGSDKQDLLSYFDGVGATVLRAGGIKADVSKIYLSILGTIQPDVLRQAMDNTNDVDGSWSRFIFAIQPNLPGKMPDDNGSIFDMSDLIAGFFRKIHELPITQYRLSKEAFKLYQPCYNRLEQLRVSHPSSGMRTVYGKAEGLIGRLALNLHVLHELASERSPSVEIPLERIKEAISLMKFYIGQIKLIYAFVDDSTPVPQVLKVIELSKRKQLGGEDGWIKAKDIQNASSKKQRAKVNEIREWISQAVQSGYGETRGEGVRLEFRAFTEELRESRSKVGDGRLKVGSEPTVETLGISSFKEKVGSVGHSYDDSPTVKITQPIINDLLVDKNLIGDEPTELTNTPNPDTAPVIAVGCEPTFAPTVEPTFQNAQVEAVTVANHSESTGQIEITARPDAHEDNSKTVTPVTRVTRVQTDQEPVTEVESKPVTPRSLLEIEKNGGDINEYVDCEVEVRSCINGKVNSVGRLSSGNVSPEGNVAVITLLKGEEIAHIREVYLIGNKPLMGRLLEVWENVPLLGELAFCASPEQLQLTFAQCSPEQVDCINNAVFELVEASVVLMRDFLPEMDTDTLEMSIEGWQPKFLQAVRKRLTQDEREALKQIAANPKDWEENSENSFPSTANSNPAPDNVDLSEGYAQKWNVGDRVNYLGEIVTVAKLDPKDGSIFVRCENDEIKKAEECLLFKLG